MSNTYSDEPHVRCNLKHCSPCTARSKRTGLPCRQPAMINRKCRFHGGKSTGPRTPEGLIRSKNANYKHGLYSSEYLQKQKKARELMRMVMNWYQSMGM